MISWVGENILKVALWIICPKFARHRSFLFALCGCVIIWSTAVLSFFYNSGLGAKRTCLTLQVNRGERSEHQLQYQQ